jgi:hypothetical protein
MNNFDWQAIIFDFDGVVVESGKIKTQAFAELYRALRRRHRRTSGAIPHTKRRHVALPQIPPFPGAFPQQTAINGSGRTATGHPLFRAGGRSSHRRRTGTWRNRVDPPAIRQNPIVRRLRHTGSRAQSHRRTARPRTLLSPMCAALRR